MQKSFSYTIGPQIWTNEDAFFYVDISTASFIRSKAVRGGAQGEVKPGKQLLTMILSIKLISWIDNKTILIMATHPGRLMKSKDTRKYTNEKV